MLRASRSYLSLIWEKALIIIKKRSTKSNPSLCSLHMCSFASLSLHLLCKVKPSPSEKKIEKKRSEVKTDNKAGI